MSAMILLDSLYVITGLSVGQLIKSIVYVSRVQIFQKHELKFRLFYLLSPHKRLYAPAMSILHLGQKIQQIQKFSCV